MGRDSLAALQCALHVLDDSAIKTQLNHSADTCRNNGNDEASHGLKYETMLYPCNILPE
jgi:hypothetical protein